MSFRYSAAEIETIRTLAEAGWTDAEMSVRMGRSAHGIAIVRRRRGIPSGECRRITLSEVERIDALVQSGMTSAEVGREIGRTEGAVVKIRCTRLIEAPRIGPAQLKFFEKVAGRKRRRRTQGAPA